MIPEYLIAIALIGHVRVNEANRTVEIYDDYGVKMVLRDLSEEQFAAFQSFFPKV